MMVPDQDEDLVEQQHWGCGCLIVGVALLGLGYWFIMWLSTQTS